MYRHKHIKNLSPLFLLPVIAWHIYGVYRDLFYQGDRFNKVLPPSDELLKYFRPFEFIRDIVSEPRINFDDVLGLVLVIGTISLCILVAFAITRMQLADFWWFGTPIILLVLCGLLALVAFYVGSGYPIHFSVYVEVIGWFALTSGLITDRASKHKLWEPVILQEIGIGLLAAASFIFYFNIWRNNTILLVLTIITAAAYLTHFAILCFALKSKQSFQPTLSGLGHKVGRNFIIAIPTIIAAVAAYYAWRSNHISQTSGQPKIEIAGQNSMARMESLKYGSMMLCRQQIVINNIGGSGTSVTEVDMRVNVEEETRTPTVNEIVSYFNEVKKQYSQEAFDLDVTEVLELTKSYFTYSQSLRGTQYKHSIFPSFQSGHRTSLGTTMFYVWGSEPPNMSDVLSLYRNAPFGRSKRVVDLSSRENSLLSRPIAEYFDDGPQHTLPTFVEPNSSTSIYVDVLTIFSQTNYINWKKLSNVSLSKFRSTLPGVYVATKNSRNGDLSVNMEALLHFTSHKPMVTPDYRYERPDCEFDSIKIPTP